MRKFDVEPGPHGGQLCISGHDLTLAECRVVRAIVTNRYMESDDYILRQPTGAFLQGYEEPHDRANPDGWVLVEFWSDDLAAIQKFVNYINKQINDEQFLDAINQMFSDE